LSHAPESPQHPDSASAPGAPRADARWLEAFHPFTRLNRLLADVEPGGAGSPLNLALGEPQNQPPGIAAIEIARRADLWYRYPPLDGTAEYRHACTRWLERRFGIPEDLVDPATQVVPCPGSREALFFAALVAVCNRPEVARPAILVPSPSYHVYAAAAAAAGAEPLFLPALNETGFLPDLAAIDPEVLERTVLAFFCSPANPQGAVADLGYLTNAIRLAREHGFVAAFDECYSEIYGDAPPPGALQAAAGLEEGTGQVLVFHSLSKRSSAPGLRCGFVAGDPVQVARLRELFKFGGAGVPLPILYAGARLWNDDDHVEVNRRRYRDNFDAADDLLGRHFGYRRPDGGFFLWLDVGDGERAAQELWSRAGIRVLPGAYLVPPGTAHGSEAARYVRVALVHDLRQTQSALRAMVDVLE
jgi:N-succinyldiaminopimelate aminotransferase